MNRDTEIRPLWQRSEPAERPLSVLLIGPYDPHCGEYTFLAPPLGVWRLSGFVDSIGHRSGVFDPNCCVGDPAQALTELLRDRTWDVIGVSTTGMTLRYDLSLAHLARKCAPHALLIAGGMEATFVPDLLFRLAPIDLVILGEGEKPLLELIERMSAGASLVGIPGTAIPLVSGGSQRFHGTALNRSELSDVIALTPYSRMPYEAYWHRLEEAYRVEALPFKAEREARLAEIRSVRLITLNYCPMACTFCSSTNFLHSAQGSVAKIARLTALECLRMIKQIVTAQPNVRTIIFQDDIFVFTKDKRIIELCDLIRQAKAHGEIPAELQFISTNRIDAMTTQRLAAMKAAGFRVIGFGVESFSRSVLNEFNKDHIYEYIEPTLDAALELEMTPFLDLILSSPRSSIEDVAETLRHAYRWMMSGCEVGLYPYVVPFSGAQMAEDPELRPYMTTTRQTIPGTEISWPQPEHILPIDPRVRAALREIVSSYENALPLLAQSFAHIPSRARSLLWVACAIPVIRAAGARLPDADAVRRKLDRELSRASRSDVDDCAMRPASKRVA